MTVKSIIDAAGAGPRLENILAYLEKNDLSDLNDLYEEGAYDVEDYSEIEGITLMIFVKRKRKWQLNPKRRSLLFQD